MPLFASQRAGRSARAVAAFQLDREAAREADYWARALANETGKCEAGHQEGYWAGLSSSRLCSSRVSRSISRVSSVLVLSSSSCSVKS